MESSLLTRLIAFYEEDPADPFNSYALALEYQKTDRAKAAALFRTLLDQHSEYLATYYSAGQFFADQEEFEYALTIYRKGIELAQAQGNSKTMQELQRAMRSLLDDMEE